MGERKDYYQILGITEDEKKLQGDEFIKAIKPKYRKICLANHPDKNAGNKNAEQKFKDAVEAWEVLSNPQKRQEYDNPASNFQFSGGSSMDEILKHFASSFGFDPFGGMSGTFTNSANIRQKGQDIAGTVTYTLEDVMNGMSKVFKYKKNVVCHVCNGTGMDSHSKEESCPHCHGIGRIRQVTSFMTMEQTCPYCQGQGKIIKNPCHCCGGNGVELQTSEFTLNIEKGVKNGATFVMRGKGNEIPGKYNIPGDVYVTLKELPHNEFVRDGNNLIKVINVPVIDAILGSETEVKTLSGKYIKVSIPQGSEENSCITVKREGLPEYKSSIVGDLICRIHISMPKELSKSQIQLLKEYKNINDKGN